MSLVQRTVFILCLSVAANVYSLHCAQNNNQLTGLLGVIDSTGRLYVEVASVTKECGCDQIRFSSDNADTDKALSILLAAKVSSLNVRIDFLDSSDCDSAFKVYMQ